MAHTRFSAREIAPVREGVRVFELGGIFTSSPEAYEFLEDVREVLKTGDETIILDLAGVSHLASGGVGVLAALFTAARDENRTLRLAGSHERLLAVMRVSRLLDVIPCHDTVEEAANAT